MPTSNTNKSILELEVELKGFSSAMSDVGKLDAAIDGLNGDVDIKASVDDSDLKTAVGLANDLNANTSMKVNVDDSDVRSTKEQLDDIEDVGIIDLTINAAGTAVGFFEGLGRFSGVGGILELDSALATLEARTGKMIPDAEKLINDLYKNGWGESRTQIAGVVAQAAQLGLEGADLEAAVLSTLQVVAVTGGDATETLNKLDTAAKANGISFTESADLFVAGYQNGGDKADDLLDTISEYGTQFKQFGLSAEGAMSFLTSGLEAGVFNADTLGDTVKELGIRLAEVGTTPAITEAFESLDSLSDIDLSGLLDGYKAGTVTGDDMLEGIFDALAEVSETDKTAATLIAAQLVGTTSEIVGTDIWGQLTTDADTALGEIEGRAETAGNTISDTLGVTVDTFLRGIEQMAVDLLSSDAIDLDGKIETFKTQLQTAMSTLAEGGSLGEAIEIGFGIEGVDTALGNVERVFGQFYLSLLEVVAFIQDPTGQTDNDSLTRSRLASGAAAQLPFDLQVANADEVESLLKQAVARGVTDIAGGITTALDEAIAAGDFDQVATILQGVMETTEIPAEAATALVNNYIAKVDEAMAVAKPPAETDGWWARLKPPDDFSSMKGGSDAAGAKGTNWWENIEVSPEAIASLDSADDAVTALNATVSTGTEAAALAAGVNTQGIVDAIAAMQASVSEADTSIASDITDNTITASFDAMSTSADLNAQATKASFMSILSTVAEVDIRMSAFFNSIMARVGAVNSAIEGIGTVPSGGGGNTTNTNITVTNNTSTQSPAQADGLGYRFAAQIRGFG